MRVSFALGFFVYGPAVLYWLHMVEKILGATP